VSQEILKKFPNTLKLASAAMIIAIFFGMGAGILSSIKQGKFIDRLISLLAILGISTPVFWLGLLLILLFSIHLKIFPSSGMEGISCIVLPAFTLGTRSIAFIARITRSSMLEVLGEDYIRTARAKGLKEEIVVLKHALKNALIPVVTMVGLDFGSYLNGSVLTETIFGWPGLGRYAVVEGIMKRDLPVVMGTVLFGATIFVLVNLIVDILYNFLDPRIKYE
jgi:ABC-type dipeptide/oligopeptide/nickel transport system permease component